MAGSSHNVVVILSTDMYLQGNPPHCTPPANLVRIWPWDLVVLVEVHTWSGMWLQEHCAYSSDTLSSKETSL